MVQTASPTALRPPPDYGRLAGFLSGHAGRTATLTFAELERLLGAPLPPDAYEERAWWEGKGRPHVRSWRQAGWRVEAADVLGRVVTFVRDER